jgi:hypothetical protein
MRLTIGFLETNFARDQAASREPRVSLCEPMVNARLRLTGRKPACVRSADDLAPVNPNFSRRLLSSAAIDAADAKALVDLARAIKRSGATARLRGRNIALISASGGSTEARRFDALASALGARVAHLAPEPTWVDGNVPIDEQAVRLFERLYDAVDCEELPRAFVQRLAEQLELPVYEGLARDDHPVLELLPRVADDAGTPDEQDRCALRQAALVSCLT